MILYRVIVTAAARDTAKTVVREWLRNERRLGVAHLPLAPIVRRVNQSAPTDPPPDARGPARVRPARPAARGPRGAIETEARAALDLIDREQVRACTRCPLHAQRTKTVFGVGRSRPEIVFVGEGPGADEDRSGEPFVGRAGQLLTRMIAAMTLTRDQVYICNVVKCRPPGNRTPTDDEMNTCSGYLFQQLAILRPRVIVTLGRPAAQCLLGTKSPIGRLRGKFYDFPSPAQAGLDLPAARLMPTFHPAYLLRSPSEKGKAWDDLKQVMDFLGIPLPPAAR